MSFFGRLFDSGRSSMPKDEREMHRLALLLASEMKLYNEEALEAETSGAELPSSLVKEVARAYELYTKTVGASEKADSIFCLELANALSRGDERPVRSALVKVAGIANPGRPA